jgi:thiol peroxidase
MATITFKSAPVHTKGDLPKVGSKAPEFRLVKTDLSEMSSQDTAGKRVILNIFPSIDTPVCATSVRRFNEQAAGLKDTLVLCVSKDLPFAHKRFCGAEGIDKVHSLSAFRGDFGEAWGVTMQDGPLRGLLARAVVVIDPSGKVAYTEQVADIASEPDYEKALAAAR